MASILAAVRSNTRWRQAWDPALGRRRFVDEDFEGRVFQEPVDLSNAVFERVSFRGARFEKSVDFRGAVFLDAHFDCAAFCGSAYFADVDFVGPASFERAAQGGDYPLEWPEEVEFAGWADFTNARFHDKAGFGGVRFQSRAMFGGAEFAADAMFTGARFCEARTFGPMDVAGRLALDRASFEAPVRIFFGARRALLRRTQFLARTTIQVSWAHVVMDDVEFAHPSVLAGPAQPPEVIGASHGRESPTPSIRSMRHANVGNLTLADVNLAGCRFAGAHRLDGLRLDGRVRFADRPDGTLTRRRSIAEERDYRERPESEHVRPDRVARTYRALRKGREDNKDEPGAADFYYGEMEMRRRGATGPERAVLELYRVVSGYGIRASRSFLFLIATIVAAAFALHAGGFKSEQTLLDSFIYSVESAASFFRGPTVIAGSELDTFGHIVQIILRLLGPLFFGLALLALRGRVKR